MTEDSKNKTVNMMFNKINVKNVKYVLFLLTSNKPFGQPKQ